MSILASAHVGLTLPNVASIASTLAGCFRALQTRDLVPTHVGVYVRRGLDRRRWMAALAVYFWGRNPSRSDGLRGQPSRE